METDPIRAIRPLQRYLGHTESIADPIAGNGVEAGMTRPMGDELTVQIFPDVHLARVHTRLLDVTVRSSTLAIDDAARTLQITGQCEHEAVYLTLHENGTLVLGSVAAKPNGQSDEQTSRDTEALSAGPSGRPDPAPALRDTGEDNGDGEHPRVTLLGRVGAEPRFRTTKNETLVCSFPLAVHDDTGKTTWRKVVAFKERAAKLQDNLQKGQEVEVVGYLHTSEGKDKDGNPKVIEEVWAAVVKKPKSKE